MQVINSEKINPFGGINFVFESFDVLKIDKILQEELPKLPNQSNYSWKDILYSFWSIFFCNGDCIEDIGLNQKDHLKNNPFIKIPSPDCILKRFKELSVPDDFLETQRGKVKHQFNINDSLNNLLLSILKKCGLIDEQNLICDYDNTIITTNKADSKTSYIKKKGYQPGIGFINNNIAFIENRNGNSDAQTLQDKTLERMFDGFKEQGIKIEKFRADSASYLFSVLLLLEKEVEKFYIRARKSASLLKQIGQINDWQEVEGQKQKTFRAEIKFTPFTGSTAERHKIKNKDLKAYRFIITKEERKDKQVNLFTNEAFIYSIIMTNDNEMNINEVVSFYNQRGKTEREFEILKNDFSWKKPAFSKLEHNTVFLIFTAICKNLYQFIINGYSKIYKHLKPTFRIKKFIFRFICIPSKWIFRSRQKILKLYGSLKFRT